MQEIIGIRPYAEYIGPNHQLLTQSREEADGNRYLYVYNYCPNDYHENSSIESVRTEGFGVKTVNTTVETVKTEINVQLEALDTWDNIPEIGKEVSGTGHYEATFNWDASAADGAYLDFGDHLEQAMEVWINGVKVGGDVSTNPTKAKQSVGVEVDGVIPEGKDEYTGGVNLIKPVADISEYLVDGENTIVIEYYSSLTNVQLARGAVVPRAAIYGWFTYTGDYRSNGPMQAVIVPFVEETIEG